LLTDFINSYRKESLIFFVLGKEQRGSEGVNALCPKLLFILFF